MRLDKQFGIRLLTAGLTFGLAGLAYAQDAAPPATGEPPKTAEAETAEAETAEAKPDGADAKPAAAGGERRREGRPSRGEFRRADPQRMLQRMQESFNDLNLSDEQKMKIQAIVDKAKPQLEALVKETEGAEPRERATKLREAAQPVREELMAVLDETQRQKFRERMEAARAAGGGGRGGTPMLQTLKENLGKLGLTDEQKTQVDALIADSEKQFAAIRAETGQGGPNPEARAKFRELMQANRKKLNEILTPEQQQKLRELSPQRRRGDGQGRRPGGAGDGNAPAPDGAPREPL